MVPDYWTSKPLRELVSISKGKKVATQDTWEQDSIPYIGANAFTGNFTVFTSSKNAVVCGQDDILILWDGERSGLAAIGLHGAVGSTVARLCSKSNVNYRFLYYFIDSKFKWIQEHRTGLAIPHVPKDLKDILIIDLPPLPEQKIIAAILSSVDDAIHATQAVIDQTRTVKQGLLQQLLTHGIGHTRFKQTEIGEIPEEWNAVRLGEVFSHRKEPGISGLPVISVTMNDGLVERHTLDRRVVSELLPEKHLRAHKGDLVYNMMRMWQGALGVAWNDCIVSPAYVICNPSDLILPRFIAQFFKAPATIRKLHQHSQGITEDRLRLYFQNFAEIVIGLPPKMEQEQISDILESIDNEVTSLKNELDSLQRIKKAMMQDLLTGRVRVKLDEVDTT